MLFLHGKSINKPGHLDLTTTPNPIMPLLQQRLLYLLKQVRDVDPKQLNETDGLHCAMLEHSVSPKHERFLAEIREIYTIWLVQKGAMDEFYEARKQWPEILGELHKIELLLLPQSSQQTYPLAQTRLFLVELQKLSTLAANFREISDYIFPGVESEVQKCSELHKDLQVKFKEVYDIRKVDLSDFSLLDSPTLTEIGTMIFPGLLKCLVDSLLSLEQRLVPVAISMDLLTMKVSEVAKTTGAFFPDQNEMLQLSHNHLQSQHEMISGDARHLRARHVTSRWNVVTRYFLAELLELMTRAANSLSQSASLLKVCSNAVSLIRLILLNKLAVDDKLSEDFNFKVLPQWGDIHALMMPHDIPGLGIKIQPGLRPLRMAKSRTPLAETSAPPVTDRFTQGVDLKLEVDTVVAPFSALKKDRIINLAVDPNFRPSRKILAALAGIANEMEGLSISHNALNATPETPQLSRQFESRIPRIRKDFITTGNFIAKMDSIGLRIPTIAATHRVFQLPERRSPQKPLGRVLQISNSANIRAGQVKKEKAMQTPLQGLKSPPAFLMQHNRRISASTGSPISFRDVRPKSRQPSLASINTPNLSYMSVRTPNLSYSAMRTPSTGFTSLDCDTLSPDEYHLRSSSPERPGLSMGSRFDAIHLTQPLQKTRKRWA